MGTGSSKGTLDWGPSAARVGDVMAGEGSPRTEAARVSALHLRVALRPGPPLRGECPGASPNWAGNGGLRLSGATGDLGTPGIA